MLTLFLLVLNVGVDVVETATIHASSGFDWASDSLCTLLDLIEPFTNNGCRKKRRDGKSEDEDLFCRNSQGDRSMMTDDDTDLPSSCALHTLPKIHTHMYAYTRSILST